MRKLKENNFDNLCSEVCVCAKCPRMNNSARVLNRSSGNIYSNIMFIGEAPGRRGADNSYIPFHGDESGHNFEDLLSSAAIDRSQVFVTNAVLCNPKNDMGTNATPSVAEIRNCTSFLRHQIDIVNPRIVITLGIVALTAVNMIEKHNLTLKKHVRTSKLWYDKLLIPLYHPGRRAMVHRSWANQTSDYRFVVEQLKRLSKSQSKVYGQPGNDVKNIVDLITGIKSYISYFALHKLVYLIEYHAVRDLGRRITTAYFIRQKDGPYCTDLHLNKIRKAFSNIDILKIEGKIILRKRDEYLLNGMDEHKLMVEDDVQRVVSMVINKYGDMDDEQLKNKVYLTRPMRRLLRAELEGRKNLINAPIDFG